MADELSDYMVLSRGQWDADASPADIQTSIDQFYEWRDKLVREGKMKGGQRLARQARLVTRQAVIDGPFSEAKEIIGGYWFIVAASLDEAAKIAAQNPCLARGLVYEVRPVDPAKASAYTTTNETPTRAR